MPTRPDIQAILDTLYHPGLKAIDLGLARVERFLARIGQPHLRLPPVIHVAGTNGKGSLVAFLHAIFKAAGARAHRYISPHLVAFNERIVLNHQMISDEQLLDYLSYIQRETAEEPLTFFEATTALAFLAFAEEPADILLLEVGMGGRLDATNMVPQPLLTAITPVAMDHAEFLGDTIAKIAAEKAGIIKPGAGCVVGPQSAEALAVITAQAEAKGAPLWREGQEWQLRERTYQSAQMALDLPTPALAGAHQWRNAATAVACVDWLRGAQRLPFAVENAHIVAGVEQAEWPGRLQRLRNGALAEMLGPGAELWLDGGHNPHAGAMLKSWIDECTFNKKIPVYAVVAMSKGKDVAGFLAPLRGVVAGIYATEIPGESLSQSAEELAKTAEFLGFSNMVAVPSPREALKRITTVASGPHAVLICGSLYLAGWVLENNR